MGWNEAYEHARRQGGVLLCNDGPQFGLSSRQIRDRGRREGWDRPFRGQVVLPGALKSHRRRIWSALLAVGGEVAVAGKSALWLHGLVEQAPSTIELVSHHHRRAPDFGPGLHLIRSRTLREDHLCEIDGVPVTTVARTIGDAARHRQRAKVRAHLIDARQRGLVDFADVLFMTRDMKGATGMPMVRELCWQLDAIRCDSVLADWLRHVLERAGMRPDPGEHPVLAPNGVTVHLDVAFVDERVAGEADGMGAHAARTSHNADARRRNTLRLIPWEIIHVTWDMLEQERTAVVADFRDALDRARQRNRVRL